MAYFNQLNQTERKALKQRYAQPKKIKYWEVLDLNIVIFRHAYPAICENFIKQNGLTNAYKRAVYENH